MSTYTHGTRYGYTAGCRCTPCTEAQQAYDKARPYDPTRAERARVKARARSAALSRLARMHPALFAALYEEEKQRVGVA